MDLFADGAYLPRGVARIGLLPGSFNPPHGGHIELAIRAKSYAGLDRVLFYVNSFNLAKQSELVSIHHRRSMLQLMLDPSDMAMIPLEFYQDAPEEALTSAGYSFAPLIAKLRRSAPGSEIWMLRGADYFPGADSGAPSYPVELWDLPHVVGTRGLDDDDIDLSMLTRSLRVTTHPLSSSGLHRQFEGGSGTGGRIDPRIGDYIGRHCLYGQGQSPTVAAPALAPAM